MKHFIKLFSLLAIMGVTNAYAVPITDVKEYSNNATGEYFVVNDAAKYSSPYYRGASQDWEWMHGGIAGSFTTASLEISAFDVDFNSGSSFSEIDDIFIWNGASWLGVGNLEGNNNIWEFTSFDLTSYIGTGWFETEVASGLKVMMDIDLNNQGWFVTLGKSTLTLDGGSQQCVPTPGVPCTPTTNVPEPGTLALLAFGIMGLGAVTRRKKSS